MAISFGGKEATYLSNFILELGFKSCSSVTINCGSTVACCGKLNVQLEDVTHRFALLLPSRAGQGGQDHHPPCANAANACRLRDQAPP